MLLALVDANYMFRYIDVGCNGRVSDGGVYRNSILFTALSVYSLNVPAEQPPQGYDVPLPYVVVADDAFPLKSYMMKPFAQRGLSKEHRTFNYRLRRALRVVENAFGILANRFQILSKTINLPPERVQQIVLACCAHNTS